MLQGQQWPEEPATARGDDPGEIEVARCFGQTSSIDDPVAANRKVGIGRARQPALRCGMFSVLGHESPGSKANQGHLIEKALCYRRFHRCCAVESIVQI